jgi:hypothetical protein
MPHRDPLFATLSKCAQMRTRLEEVGVVPPEWREPRTLPDAIAQLHVLETLLNDAHVVLSSSVTKEEAPRPAYDESLDQEDGAVSRREERRATVVKIAVLAPVIAIVCAYAYISRVPQPQSGFRAAVMETPPPSFFSRTH